MQCFKPQPALQHIRTGRVSFTRERGTPPTGYKLLKLRCTKCIGCRLEYSRQWAIRMMHEASMHDANCFLTLTYNDDKLPDSGSLVPEHLTAFFKRLRYHIAPFPMKYFACGEYGSETKRAHYHAAIFQWEPNDLQIYKQIHDYRLYTSEQLDNIWGHGHCTVGALTLESAQYVAKYMNKRFTGEGYGYYQLIEQTGELIPVQQPYAVMSTRPAIAANWIRRYSNDIYAADKDTIHIEGVPHKPPKFYDRIYDTINHEHMEHIKQQRTDKATPLSAYTLRAREKHAHAQIVLKRGI